MDSSPIAHMFERLENCHKLSQLAPNSRSNTLAAGLLLELLPVQWRRINAYGIRVGYRTYDCAELGRGGCSTPVSPPVADCGRCTATPTTPPTCSSALRDGWVSVPWTHLPMVAAPFAEFTWRHARALAAEQAETTPRDRGRAGARRPAEPRAGRAGEQLSDRIAARPASPQLRTGHHRGTTPRLPNRGSPPMATTTARRRP